uniref:Schlafen AlbA-2 domain-containing protein n=1 Tax=Latimeria chalumnae TaxID=7897 RepID=H3BGW0_LATCH
MENEPFCVLKTSYPDLTLDVGKATLGEKSRKKKMNSYKDQKSRIVRASCALLNSGGGVLIIEIENPNYRYQEDGIGLDIEKALRELVVETKAYIEYMQQGNYMLIFVKSWSNEILSANSARKPRICSVDSGLFRRYDTSTKFIDSRRRYHAQLDRNGEMGPMQKRARLSDMPEAESHTSAEKFFERNTLVFGETLDFTESQYVEFKNYLTKKCLVRLKEMLLKYISAFANTYGGFLFIGVDDKTRTVVGCRKEENDPRVIETEVKKQIGQLYCEHFCASQEELGYEFKVMNVLDKEEAHCGYVLALKIRKFCCAVFCDKPDCWVVQDEKAKRLEPHKWLEIMTATDPVVSQLAEDFQNVLSVSSSPPQCKSVYSRKELGCVEDLQKYLFQNSSLCSHFQTKPESLYKELCSEWPALLGLTEKVKIQNNQGLLIFSRSWAVDIELRKDDSVVCDALLIATSEHPTLYTVVKDCSHNDKVLEHSRSTAFALKQKLVNLGGYSEKVCVIPKVFQMSTGNLIEPAENTEGTKLQVRYPYDYEITSYTIKKLLHSLIIVLLSFKSFLSDQLGCEFLNLLTAEQFEILHFKHDIEKCKKIFVHGLPGTGKTVVALKLIERIKNVFNCQKNEVLYICENEPLKNFVSQKGICECATRKGFMKLNFQAVKHIVVDEAQNFQNEDGPWYSKAEKICTNSTTHPNDPGVFWIFADYFQQCHTKNNGLPSLSKQYPQEWLTKGVRNAKNIVEVMHSLLKKIVTYGTDNEQDHKKRMLEEYQCAHTIPGQVEEQAMTEEEMKMFVMKKIQEYLKCGYTQKDIAVLCSTKDKAEHYWSLLEDELRSLNLKFKPATEILGDHIILDSVRRFSGLERNIVFGINPVASTRSLSQNLFLCLASRANTILYVLY